MVIYKPWNIQWLKMLRLADTHTMLANANLAFVIEQILRRNSLRKVIINDIFKSCTLGGNIQHFDGKSQFF
jgi:hypothetical protein